TEGGVAVAAEAGLAPVEEAAAAYSAWEGPGRAPSAVVFRGAVGAARADGAHGEGPPGAGRRGEGAPNCAMGSRGWRIWCIVCAASSASWGGRTPGGGTPGRPAAPPTAAPSPASRRGGGGGRGRRLEGHAGGRRHGRQGLGAARHARRREGGAHLVRARRGCGFGGSGPPAPWRGPGSAR
ncbi:hypothetical protein ANANG_G00073600, partial [Anguilla anguilla]